MNKYITEKPIHLSFVLRPINVPGEWNIEPENDCIELFSTYLRDYGILTEKVEKELDEAIMNEINEATDYAEQAAFASPDTLLDYVYEK